MTICVRPTLDRFSDLIFENLFSVIEVEMEIYFLVCL